MEQLKTIRDSIELYNAGLPGFPRVFFRDSIISGLLMDDANLIRNNLIYSALRQGTKSDPHTGEEKGKIFHESPGVVINGLSTEYNACDTTALFLLGHEHYALSTGDPSLKERQRENLLKAVEYIRSHIIDGVFYENPRLSGANRFALKVTYWKDSDMVQRENGMPAYPVAYFLAHAINLAGIRSASRLLESEELRTLADQMKESMHKFFDPDKKRFYIAIDAQGPVESVSSDMLHALFYLEQGDLTEEETAAIAGIAAELETPAGYLTLSRRSWNDVADQYHARTVWPFEQAIINNGARKFGLEMIVEGSGRIMSHLDTNPEILVISADGIKKGGCDPQLWTIAAKRYFERARPLQGMQVPLAETPPEER
jgi:glycogen debranching enzyme